MIGASTLWVYDLQSGRKAGETRAEEQFLELNCKGMAFSPDGAELAGLFDSFGSTCFAGTWRRAGSRISSSMMTRAGSRCRSASRGSRWTGWRTGPAGCSSGRS